MINIITIFDRNEEFIKLQFETIKNNVIGEYEYIVFNNGSTNEQKNKIKKICDELKIQNIEINVNYNNSPSYIAGSALNESFKYLKNKKVFKIDSDMFFINKININEFIDTDLVYIPTYQTDKTLVWSGVFGINMEKITEIIDFNPHVIVNTDTFGYSSILLKNLAYSKKVFNLYMIHKYDNKYISGSLNNDCIIEINNNKITSLDKKEFYQDFINNETINKFKIFTSICDKYKFPKPINIDFIEYKNNIFILHYKSSNWDFYGEEYFNLKTNSIKEFINDNYKFNR